MKYPSTHEAYLESLTDEDAPEPICEKCGDAKKDAPYDTCKGCMCEDCYAVYMANYDFENGEEAKVISGHPAYIAEMERLEEEQAVWEREQEVKKDFDLLGNVFAGFKETFGGK